MGGLRYYALDFTYLLKESRVTRWRYQFFLDNQIKKIGIKKIVNISSLGTLFIEDLSQLIKLVSKEVYGKPTRPTKPTKGLTPTDKS